jgi:hypothetical protein
MRKHRQDAKVDANQPGIVSKLRSIPGVTVELNHDDILVGYRNLTFWYEIKNPELACDKNGKIRESAIKPDQKRIRAEFTGHYKIVSSFEEIWEDIQNTIKRLRK